MPSETELVWPTTSVTRGWLADPIDPDIIVLRDDFIGGGAASGSFGSWGELGWSQANIVTAGTTDWIAGIANHPGIIRLGTGANDNDGQVLTLGYGPGFIQIGRLMPLNALAGWKMRFIFRINSTASIAFRIGVVEAAQAQVLKPATFIGWQYDTDDTDVNFSLVCRSASLETKTASAVAADTGWHVVEIYSDTSGTITGTIDGGAAINIAATVTALSTAPFCQLGTRTTAVKTADFDFFGLTATIAR